jgi:hypothetical protein
MLGLDLTMALVENAFSFLHLLPQRSGVSTVLDLRNGYGKLTGSLQILFPAIYSKL